MKEELTDREALALAIDVAAMIHSDQFDKAGMPYILHPLHVMNKLSHDIVLMTIAVLHDTVEDNDGVITLDYLREIGFSERVVTAIDLLTHKKGDSYMDYIKSILPNSDATKVKGEDLKHNMDINRLVNVTKTDMNRIKKYNKAYFYLFGNDNRERCV